MVNVNPIRNDADLDAAFARLDVIFLAEEGTPEGDERDILVDLIELYEDKHYPIGPPTDPIAAIEFELELRGLDQGDLIPLIGSRRKVAEVLSGQRDITMPMARALHKHLGIPAETLLHEPVRNRDKDCVPADGGEV